MTPETRSVAQQIQASVSFNFIVLLQCLNATYGKMYETENLLQDPTINFKETATYIVFLEQKYITLNDSLNQADIENDKTE